MHALWGTVQLQIKLLDPDARMPFNAYGNDAGWDLHVLRAWCVPAGEGTDVPTGVAVAIPDGWYGRIVGRSSAFRKKGLIVMEGTIDAGFRGELYSYCYNPGPVDVWLEPGDSVAQLIVLPVPTVEWHQVGELPPSSRGTNGFGSSGR